MRVLLVEDTDDTRELFRTMLEKLGHEVIEASNGRDGVRAAIRHGADFALVDLSMPEIDGFETAAALRAISDFGQIPIVAVSAFPPSYWKEKALDAGYNAYLQKPVTFERLSEVLKAYSSQAT